MTPVIAPLAYVAYEYVSTENAPIDFAGKEQVGVAYITPIETLSQPSSGTATSAAALRLWQPSGPHLDALLRARMARFTHAERVVEAIALFTPFLAAYLFAGFYRPPAVRRRSSAPSTRTPAGLLPSSHARPRRRRPSRRLGRRAGDRQSADRAGRPLRDSLGTRWRAPARAAMTAR